MAKNGPWYKRYPSSFITATLGMSLEEKGAYSLLLDLMYDRGKPIPDDVRYIAGVCNCSVRKWRVIRGRLIQLEKIVIEDGFITNRKAEEEIKRAHEIAEKRRESALKCSDKSRENKPRYNKNNNMTEAFASLRARSQKLEVSSNEDTSPLSDPPLFDEEVEEQIEKPKKNQATSLPDDWAPTENDVAFAYGEGLNEMEVNREADRFRDYWHSASGQNSRKKDWSATWRNWIRKSVDGRGQASGGKTGQGRPKSGGIVASANRLLSQGSHH